MHPSQQQQNIQILTDSNFFELVFCVILKTHGVVEYSGRLYLRVAPY